MKTSLKSRKGFTLIELLLVIGIIAILAAIVIVAINPTKQLGDARDAQRRSDVNTILNAIWQYAIDNNGAMPGDSDPSDTDLVDGTWRMLGTALAGCDLNASGEVCYEETADGAQTAATDCLHLGDLTGTYVVNIPSDPRYGSADAMLADSKTMYIVRESSNRVTVSACQPEQETSISVTR